MSKEYYVFSTLAADTAYAAYIEGGADMPIQDHERTILIRGGAGVATKHLVTPYGVMTKVSEEELALLKKNAVFQLHMDNKFITIQDKAHDAELVVTGEGLKRDNSSPITPEDFVEGEKGAKPVLKKPTTKKH